MFSEAEYLRILEEYFPKCQAELPVTRGDDCAVFNWGSPICISSDLFIENVHFRRRYFTAADIGYKALAVNISDISAMGANPWGFDMNTLIPVWVNEDFWREFLRGISELAKQFGLILLGGDLTSAQIFGVSITILGKSPERYLQRGNLEPGDTLFLKGDLGLARAGFSILESSRDKSKFLNAVNAHVRPTLQVDTAQILAGYPEVRALMDVSDGLLSDLPRFIGDKYGADLGISQADLHQEVVQYAKKINTDPKLFALQGGEDYALLGACFADGFEKIRDKIPEIKKIGKVSHSRGVYLDGELIDSMGFDHFSGAGNRKSP